MALGLFLPQRAWAELPAETASADASNPEALATSHRVPSKEITWNITSGARLSLIALGLLTETEAQNIDVDVSREVSIPNASNKGKLGQKRAHGYVVSLKGKTVGYVIAGSSGRSLAFYDAAGAHRGSPSRLIYQLRTGLIALDLVKPDDTDYLVDLSKMISIPNQKDLRGFPISRGGEHFAFVTTTNSGHLAGIYDALGNHRGNPGLLLPQIRTSLVTLGWVAAKDAPTIRVILGEQVPIPDLSKTDDDRPVRGYRVTFQDKPLAYAKTTATGQLSAIYDRDGRSWGNPTSLLYSVRSSLIGLGLITGDQAGGLRIDLSRAVPIPGTQGGESGHIVRLAGDDKELAYARLTRSGRLAGLYDAQGVPRGNPAKVFNQTRISLRSVGLLDDEDSHRIAIDLTGKASIPGRKDISGHAVTLDGETLGYVDLAVGGSIAGVYDALGRHHGNPSYLLSTLRSSLVALGKLGDDDVDSVLVDLKSEVSIPGTKKHRGHRVTLDDETLGYVETTRGGHFSGIFDTDGHAWGNPANLLSATKSSLLALGVISSDDAEGLRVDLAKEVLLPGKKQTRAFRVAHGERTIAYVKRTAGGAISAIYDLDGTPRGYPSQLLTQTRTGLAALGLVTADELSRVHIDFTEKIPVPGQPSTRGYLITLDGNGVGYVKPSTGGQLSAIFDAQGTPAGNPGLMLFNARTGLRHLGLVEKGAKVDIDFSAKAPYPVSSQGEVIAFAHPTAGGNLSKLSSAKDGSNWGNPAALCNQFHGCLKNMTEVDPKELSLLKVDFSPVVTGESFTELAVKDAQGNTRYHVVPHPLSGNLTKVLDSGKQPLFERVGKVHMGRAKSR